MAEINIYISLIPGTTRLHLEDSEGHSGEAQNFFTDVDRSDVIIWRLAKNSGIDEITNLQAKDGYFNILLSGAPQNFGNALWVGVVKDDAAGEDSYDIGYKIDGKDFSEDPLLKVKG